MVLLSLLILSQPVAAEGVWAGVFAYQQKMANYGHPEAQVKLGEMYEQGHGTEQDYAQARHWYKKAAEQGFEPAMLKLDQLAARERREAEEKKRAEAERIAREKAEAQEQARREREEQERLAREAEQQRLAAEKAAREAEEKARREEEERLARERARKAMEKMLSTPEAYAEE